MLEFIETERLLLRQPAARDAATLTVLLGDYKVSSMLARVPYPYRRSDAEAWIAQCATSRTDGEFKFTIARKTDNYAVGGIGLLQPLIEVTDAFELGYWIGKPYWKMGFATEAARAIVRFAFENSNISKLVAGHAHDNPASGRVLAKLGFAQTHMQDMTSLARGCSVPCHRLELTRDRFAQHVV